MTSGTARRNRWASVALGALVVGVMTACGDVTGHQERFDPGLTLDRLQDVLRPLEERGEFLLGLDLAVATLDYYDRGGLAAAISLREDRSEELLQSLRRSHGRVGSGVGAAAGAVAGRSASDGLAEVEIGRFTLPWSLVGETLEWDTYDGYVRSGRSGAPTNGVRFILYRMDEHTGYPLSPRQEIGYLDLVDADGSQAEVVRVRAVRTDGPDRVVANYTVSLTGSGTYYEGDMRVTTRGAIGDGSSVTLDLLQQLAWSERRDRDELTLRYDYRRGSGAVTLEGRAASRYDALEWERFDFDVEFRGGSVRTDVRAEVDSDGSLRGEILNEGRSVVRIGGYDGRPTFARSDGAAMDWSEETTLEQIWTGITDLLWLTDWVMTPADLLVASG